jgi:hypothetical protein
MYGGEEYEEVTPASMAWFNDRVSTQNQAQPQTTRKNVVSMAPTVSSVYSQASQLPVSNNEWNEQNRNTMASSYYGEDISPPDSPVREDTRNGGDVSPISRSNSSVHPAFRVTQKPAGSAGSGIPVPRKQAPSQTDASPQSAARAYKRDLSAPLRWDKYSGEPTTNKSRGLPSTVNPENLVQQIKLRSTSGKSTGGAKPEELLIDTRPPWKGASGRAPIVSPVPEKPRSPTEQIPVPNRQNRKPVGSGIPSPPYASPVYGPREMPSQSTLSTVRQADTSPHQEDEPLTPVAASRPTTAQMIDANIQDSRLATPRSDTDVATPTAGDSRFSWTTQATNTTYNKNSPPSSPENVPPLPRTSSKYATNSIMNRARPITARNYTYDDPDAEPTPSASPTERRGTYLTAGATDNNLLLPPRSSSTRSPSITSTTTQRQKGPDKALPPTPQEIASHDHVSALQAQINDLMQQRRNVEKILRDLTRPEATNPMMTNFKIEREREKRVQALRDELNEIGMLEHDVGLRLHRAQRRHEREEGYEGFNTLWVRRVTS